VDQPVELIVAQRIVGIVRQLIVRRSVPSPALHGSMPMVLHQALPLVVAPLLGLDRLAVQGLVVQRLAVRNPVVPSLARTRRCFVAPIARLMTGLAT
jgi:hypothetical protein